MSPIDINFPKTLILIIQWGHNVALLYEILAVIACAKMWPDLLIDFYVRTIIISKFWFMGLQTNHLSNGFLKHHAHPGLIKQGFLFQNMMTSSNENIFRVTGPLCGEFTGPGEFPTQRPVTRSFDVFLDLRLNKRLNKQSWCWWFETLSRPFWRHRNDNTTKATQYRKTSSISRTKFPNLNVPCILLQLSSLNPSKPGVKLRMKM